MRFVLFLMAISLLSAPSFAGEGAYIGFQTGGSFYNVKVEGPAASQFPLSSSSSKTSAFSLGIFGGYCRNFGLFEIGAESSFFSTLGKMRVENIYTHSLPSISSLGFGTVFSGALLNYTHRLDYQQQWGMRPALRFGYAGFKTVVPFVLVGASVIREKFTQTYSGSRSINGVSKNFSSKSTTHSTTVAPVLGLGFDYHFSKRWLARASYEACFLAKRTLSAQGLPEAKIPARMNHSLLIGVAYKI